ncbi:MAG: P-loop NTPase [Proteobacteria bacterium]|nr:P-loop NTPase [Pseudomonadota bacterium]
MRIAVASGKGGTGKTLVATNLARLWVDQGHVVTYVDADAEEPNGHLFLNPSVLDEERFAVTIPTLGGQTCSAHGKCQEICAFNAILSAKGRIVVFNELCHSCGACILACPDNALKEEDREIGTISFGTANDIGFVSSRLDVGEARVTPLIERVISRVENRDGIVIVDAPPGTSCSAMAAVHEADLLLLVTEPTPFGLHDLELAVGMGRAFGIELAAVINRSDLGDKRTKKYLDAEGIPVLAEIPFDPQIAKAYSESRLALNTCVDLKRALIGISKKLIKREGEEQ